MPEGCRKSGQCTGGGFLEMAKVDKREGEKVRHTIWQKDECGC